VELSRIQEEQVLFLGRIEREKQRKIRLEQDFEQVKQSLRLVQDRTKNGNIVKDNEVMNSKLFNRLETQLQTSKIKLSTARNDNINLKRRVEDLRREKLLHIQILNDFSKEVAAARRRSKFCQKEVMQMNEKKHRVKVSIANTKQKMIQDMEEFSTELTRAKESISNTQMVIMNTIREKLEQTSSFVFVPPFSAGDDFASTTPGRNPPRRESAEYNSNTVNGGARDPFPPACPTKQTGHTAQELEVIFKDTEFTNVNDLLKALQHSEDTVFALYHETQERHEEVEKMESENKRLEIQVQEQVCLDSRISQVLLLLVC
jgi:hypothetical protein